MFCTNCGNEIADGALFCTACGNKLSDEPAAPVNAGASAPQPAAGQTSQMPSAAPTVPTEQVVGQPTVVQPPVPPQQPQTAARTATPRVAPRMQYATAQPIPQQTPQHTTRMPQIMTQPTGPAGDPSQRTKTIILAALIAVIVALIIAIIFLFSCSRKAVAIDSSNFPDESMRDAVMVGLDIDGDGVLTPEEADAATGFTYSSSGYVFVTDYDIDYYLINLVKPTPTPNPNPGNTDSGKGDGGNTELSSDPTEMINEIIKFFPNLRLLELTNMGLTRLDVSNNTKLEYIDVRGNDFTSMDLSKNKELVSMFCDDDVELSGLDSAGLYYRDLMTGIRDSKAGNYGNTAFEYDGMGRVLKAGEKTFTYDEDGRLTRAQGSGSENPWYEEYKYNADGLLAEADVFQPLGVGELPIEYLYEYGDKNRLTAFSKGRNDSADYSGSIEYSGDEISKINTVSSVPNALGGTLNVKYGSNKLIEEMSSAQSSGAAEDETYLLKYLPDGACSDWLSTRRTSSSTTDDSYVTTFASDGAPQSTAVSATSPGGINSSSYNMTYETNIDGYITKMTTPDTARATVLSGTSVDISYMKHVGKLEDLPSQRYVPVYRVENTDSAFFPMMWHLASDLYSSTGDSADISVLEDGPMQITFQAMGLVPNVVSNSNEQKLAEYMAEHWKDSMDLKSTATATSKSVKSASSSSSSSSTSSNASGYEPKSNSDRVIETDDFAFTMPDSWVGKVSMEETHAGQSTQYCFYMTGGSTGRDEVMAIEAVPDNVSGDLGQVHQLKEIKTSAGKKLFITYWDGFLESSSDTNPNASKILGLQTGGAWNSSTSLSSQSARDSANKMVKDWLTANVVPNVKAK